MGCAPAAPLAPVRVSAAVHFSLVALPKRFTVDHYAEVLNRSVFLPKGFTKGSAPPSELRAARAAARQPRAPPGRAAPQPATGKARGSARARRERPAAGTQPTRVPRRGEASSERNRSISPLVTINSLRYGSEPAARQRPPLPGRPLPSTGRGAAPPCRRCPGAGRPRGPRPPRRAVWLRVSFPTAR